MKPTGRTAVRFGAAAALALLAVASLASPAAAHASLLSSDPSAGSVLTSAPKRVSLSFSENVRVSATAIQVYDTDAKRVDNGGVKARNNLVTLTVPKLEDGAYVVTWRVTSADSHPIRGAFTFQIGAAATSNNAKLGSLANRLLSDQGGDRAVGALYGVTRWTGFAGIALLIGTAAFGFLVWPAARVARRTARFVWTGWLMAAVATVVGFLVYGPYAAGLGLGDAFGGSALDDTLDSRFGKIYLARLLILALAMPLLRRILKHDGDEPASTPRVLLGAGGVLAVLVAASPGQSGHAISGDWVGAAVVADTLHVLAGSLWIGGLVLVASVLLPGRTARELEHPISRWSKLAFGCVSVIVLTGVFQGYRQVRTLEAMRQTDYGRMLVIKLIIFGALMVGAAFSRDAVRLLYPRPRRIGKAPAIAGGSDDDTKLTKAQRAEYERSDLRQLRIGVWFEVFAMVLILVITSLLVNAPPARSALGNQNLATAITPTLENDKVKVDVILTPGKQGENTLHITVLKPNGKVFDVDDLTMSITLPKRDLGPIKIPLNRLSAGHYIAEGFRIPFSGKWKIVAKPVLSEFDIVTLTDTIDVESGTG